MAEPRTTDNGPRRCYSGQQARGQAFEASAALQALRAARVQWARDLEARAETLMSRHEVENLALMRKWADAHLGEEFVGPQNEHGPAVIKHFRFFGGLRNVYMLDSAYPERRWAYAGPVNATALYGRGEPEETATTCAKNAMRWHRIEEFTRNRRRRRTVVVDAHSWLEDRLSFAAAGQHAGVTAKMRSVVSSSVTVYYEHSGISLAGTRIEHAKNEACELTDVIRGYCAGGSVSALLDYMQELGPEASRGDFATATARLAARESVDDYMLT